MLSKAAVAVGCILASGNAVVAQVQVSPDRIAAARALVDASGDGENIAYVWGTILPQRAQTGETESCRARRIEVVGKALSGWAPALKNELVQAYASHLKTQESRHVTKFFQSAAGIAFRKSLEDTNRKSRAPNITLYRSSNRDLPVKAKKLLPDELQIALDSLSSRNADAVLAFSKTGPGQKFFDVANGDETGYLVSFSALEKMAPLKDNPEVLQYKAECL